MNPKPSDVYRELYFLKKNIESIENKKELEKIILCDVQKEIYPNIIYICFIENLVIFILL